MRTKFSRARRVTADWNGNKELPEDKQIAYSYKPLEYGEFNDAVETLRRLGVMREGGTTIVVGDDAQTELFDLFKRLLPKNVTSTGAPLLATEGDDTPVTMDEIATAAPFVVLATEILATLIAVSAPTEVDLKN